VKLLFDQHISARLVAAIADIFPDSAHVKEIGLDRSTDEEIWIYARENSFILVSKD